MGVCSSCTCVVWPTEKRNYSPGRTLNCSGDPCMSCMTGFFSPRQNIWALTGFPSRAVFFVSFVNIWFWCMFFQWFFFPLHFISSLKFCLCSKISDIKEGSWIFFIAKSKHLSFTSQVVPRLWKSCQLLVETFYSTDPFYWYVPYITLKIQTFLSLRAVRGALLWCYGSIGYISHEKLLDLTSSSHLKIHSH